MAREYSRIGYIGTIIATLAAAIISHGHDYFERTFEVFCNTFANINAFLFRPDAETSLELDRIAFSAGATADRQRLPFLAFLDRLLKHPLFSTGFRFDSGLPTAA